LFDITTVRRDAECSQRPQLFGPTLFHCSFIAARLQLHCRGSARYATYSTTGETTGRYALTSNETTWLRTIRHWIRRFADFRNWGVRDVGGADRTSCGQHPNHQCSQWTIIVVETSCVVSSPGHSLQANEQVKSSSNKCRRRLFLTYLMYPMQTRFAAFTRNDAPDKRQRVNAPTVSKQFWKA